MDHGKSSKQVVWIVGTATVFVQSAAMIVVALWMRQIGVIGHFRQTKAVAALGILAAAFELLSAMLLKSERQWPYAKVCAIFIVGAVMATYLCTCFGWVGVESETMQAVLAAGEVAALLLALSMMSPQRQDIISKLL